MSEEERWEAVQAGPCPLCGVPRGEHETRSLMVHTMQAIGATEAEAEQIWDRVWDRLVTP